MKTKATGNWQLATGSRQLTERFEDYPLPDVLSLGTPWDTLGSNGMNGGKGYPIAVIPPSKPEAGCLGPGIAAAGHVARRCYLPVGSSGPEYEPGGVDIVAPG